MATSSGLYNDRVKDIMGGKPSREEDRAASYKESVEVKQTKNKIDKLDEATRSFQVDLLQVTTKSEEHLKHIAKYTKVMAKDTLTSNLLRFIKYGYIAFKAWRFFKPESLPNAIKKFEDFIQRNSNGSRGMRGECCCDSRGTAARMRRSQRRQDRRDSGYNTNVRDTARVRAEDKARRTRQAGIDRAERIRREAQELRERKITQTQIKYTQDSINKSMRRFGRTGKASVTGMFDVTAGGLKTSTKAITKAASTGSDVLMKTGLAGVAGVVAGMSNIFKSTIKALSRSAAGITRGIMGGLAALGGGKAAVGAGVAGLGAYGAYSLYKVATMDAAKELKTVKDVGAGNKYVSKQGGYLNALLFGIPNASLAETGKLLGPGAATNTSQLLEDWDHLAGDGVDFITGLFGKKTNLGRRGVLGAMGNEIGASWSRVYNKIFDPVTSAIEEQTESMNKNMDSNFKKMELDHREGRRLDLDKINNKLLSQGSGIPSDQEHQIGPMLVAPRPKIPDSHKTDFQYEGISPADRPVNQLGPAPSIFSHDLSILPGASKESQGWSAFDALGYSKPTLEGFTGTSSSYNKRWAVKNVTPKSGQGGIVTGNFSDLIHSGESRARDWNDYNRGSGGIGRGDGRHYDFSSMTIEEIMAAQDLPRGHADKLFAVGRYQIIPSTMREAVAKLGLDPKAKFTNEVQERIFRDHLVANKRPQIKDYITGDGSLDSATHALAYEFASVPDPNTGKSKYGHGNRSHHTVAATQAALKAEKLRYEANIASGMSPDAAWSALSFGGQTAGHIPSGLLNPDSIGLSYKNPNTGGSASQIAIDMANQGATRNKDITTGLKNILQYAGREAGISRIEVISGGQDPASKPGARRRGKSVNHDHGNAADFDMYVTNPDGSERKLRYSNAEDRKIIESFVEHASKAGATNIGIGPGYMADGRMHLGNTGTDGRVWGHTMTGASAEPNISAAASRGRGQRAGFDLASSLSDTSGITPIPVEIASISSKTHEDNIARYSQSSGLGSIFGINRAAAADNPDGMRSAKGGRLGSTQNSITGDFIQDRIDRAYGATTAHVAAEKIRPDVNPASSILAASEGIAIPTSVDFAQNMTTVRPEVPVNPVSTNAVTPNSVPHYADPELMYPLLYHHMSN